MKEALIKIIEVATKEVGTKEIPAGSNKVKYNTWFYGKEVQDNPAKGQYFPWCGAFVSWVFSFAGFPLGVIDYLKGFAGCPYALNHVDKWGTIVNAADAQPGYVFIVDWNGDGKPDHTGIVLNNRGNGLFDTIEGNTAIGNDSNGGEVMKRDRNFNSGKIKVYFIRPHCLEKAA